MNFLYNVKRRTECITRWIIFLCKIKIAKEYRIWKFSRKNPYWKQRIKINYFKQLYLISISRKIGPGMVKRKPVEPGRFDKNQLHFYVKECIYILFILDITISFHSFIYLFPRQRENELCVKRKEQDINNAWNTNSPRYKKSRERQRERVFFTVRF